MRTSRSSSAVWLDQSQPQLHETLSQEIGRKAHALADINIPNPFQVLGLKAGTTRSVKKIRNLGWSMKALLPLYCMLPHLFVPCHSSSSHT